MPPRTEITHFKGLAGTINCAIDWPVAPPRGWALVLHPHPLQGGTRDNKVVTTVARACVEQGLVVLRPDFRGVRASEGTFDKGEGETADMYALVMQWYALHPELVALPSVLAGFSFGTAVAVQLNASLVENHQPRPTALILVGTAAWRFQFREDISLPDNTLIIHGETDEVVPIGEVVAWAKKWAVPVVTIPDASHFFHHKLALLKQPVVEHLAHTLIHTP